MVSRLSEDGAFVFGIIDESGERWFDRISEYGILGIWIPPIFVTKELSESTSSRDLRLIFGTKRLSDNLVEADRRILVGRLVRIENSWARDLRVAFSMKRTTDTFRAFDVATKRQTKISLEVSRMLDTRLLRHFKVGSEGSKTYDTKSLRQIKVVSEKSATRDIKMLKFFKITPEALRMRDIGLSILRLLRTDGMRVSDVIVGIKSIVRGLIEITSILGYTSSRILRLVIEVGRIRDLSRRQVMLRLYDMGLFSLNHNISGLALLSELMLGLDTSTKRVGLVKFDRVMDADIRILFVLHRLVNLSILGDYHAVSITKKERDTYGIVDFIGRGMLEILLESSKVSDSRMLTLGLSEFSWLKCLDRMKFTIMSRRTLSEITSTLDYVAFKLVSLLVESGKIWESRHHHIFSRVSDIGLVGALHTISGDVVLSEKLPKLDKYVSEIMLEKKDGILGFDFRKIMVYCSVVESGILEYLGLVHPSICASERVTSLSAIMRYGHSCLSDGLAIFTKSQRIAETTIESLVRVLGLRTHTPTISAYGCGIVGDSISGSIGKGIWEFLKPTFHRSMLGLKIYGNIIRADALYSGEVLKPSIGWYAVRDKSAISLLHSVLAECGVRDSRVVFTERCWADALVHRSLILLDGLLQQKTRIALGRPEASVHASISRADVLLWSGQVSRDIESNIHIYIRLFSWQIKRIPSIIAELFERALFDLLRGLFRDADVLLNIDRRVIRVMRDTVIVYPCECRITPTVGYTHAIIEYSCDIEIYTAGEGRHERLTSMVRRIKEAVMGLHGVGEFYIILVGDADYRCTYGSPGLSCTFLRIRAKRAQSTL